MTLNPGMTLNIRQMPQTSSLAADAAAMDRT